ncbi:MAG: hypothetical protein ACOVP4_04600 [Bacteriovoracaceae bacterium]
MSVIESLQVFQVLDEQTLVGFTGKVNVLSKLNRQYHGHLLLKNGDVIQAFFKTVTGLKAFYNIVVADYELEPIIFVVEPETVEEKQRGIHYPYSVLKNRTQEIIDKYLATVKLRPPQNLKLLIKADFLNQKGDVTPEEFEVLSTLSDWNLVKDVYQNCNLVDYEITLALVGLRKKGALKVISAV